MSSNIFVIHRHKYFSARRYFYLFSKYFLCPGVPAAAALARAALPAARHTRARHQVSIHLNSLFSSSLYRQLINIIIRATVQTAGHYFCIYTTDSATYALYVTFKLLLRHVLPAILILLCILRPRSATLCISLDISISLHLSRYQHLSTSL